MLVRLAETGVKESVSQIQAGLPNSVFADHMPMAKIAQPER